MNITITSASIQEAGLVHALTQSAFVEYAGLLTPAPECLHESIADVARSIARGGAFIAWGDDGQPVGSARYEPLNGHLHVSRVAVLPAYRGLGVAGSLLAAIDDTAIALGLDLLQLQTRLNLPRNIRLYEKFGYRIIDTWQPQPGADVYVLMEKSLRQPEPV